MTVLHRIAHSQNRRDEAPNQALAQALAASKDREGIREIAENVWNKDRNIQADCVKVLYEIGYLDPSLIADYIDDFMTLLQSKNNRLAWGGMIALSTITEIKAGEIYDKHIEAIKQAMQSGSVLTMDNAVKTLAIVASSSNERGETLFPYLLRHLATCRSKDVPQHAEKILIAVNRKNAADFIRTLELRLPHLTSSQASRVKKVIKTAQASKAA